MIARTEEAADVKIPVVDLTSPNAAKELLDAAVDYGFIFIKHVDELELTGKDVDAMFDTSRGFFESPESVKSETPIVKNRGYVALNREALDPRKHKNGDYKEAFNIGEFTSSGEPAQPFPKPLIPYQKQIGSFQDGCRAICNRIFALLGAALEIPETEGGASWFVERHDRTKGPDSNTLRLLHYPPLPPSSTYDATADIRAGAHSDYGSITLLFRLPGQPGLEILTQSDTWVPVPVDPEPSTTSTSHSLPILVNIGDLLSYWTGGLLRSTVHRVVFPAPATKEAQTERYSIAYFCHPLDNAVLEEVPSELVKAHKKSGKAVEFEGMEDLGEGKIMTAKEHLMSRLAATYGGAT